MPQKHDKNKIIIKSKTEKNDYVKKKKNWSKRKTTTENRDRTIITKKMIQTKISNVTKTVIRNVTQAPKKSRLRK